MSLNRKSKKSRHSSWVAVAVLLAVGVVIAGWWRQYPRAAGQKEIPAPAGKNPAVTNTGSPGAVAAAGVPSATELARMKALFASFKRHPFAATRESGDFGWTAEDGKDPGVIQLLAHNELEYERMAEESARIFRRQLVYAKETAAQLVQQSRLSGVPIRQLALPGLDGQEIQVAITRSELNPSGQQGTFTGHVVGRLDSMVTLAFKGGREAFTVLSPADGIYLVGEPREPGELIVKSINPATYVVGVCGNP